MHKIVAGIVAGIGIAAVTLFAADFLGDLRRYPIVISTNVRALPLIVSSMTCTTDDGKRC